MIDHLEFAKLSGSGNDFICIDNRDGRFDALLDDEKALGQFARTLCRRGLAIGADGLIFAARPAVPEAADIAARFIEADGSEAELCGNGTGCFIRWVHVEESFDLPHCIRILTPAGVVTGCNGSAYVRVCIPLPEGVECDFDLEVKGRRWRCDFTVSGVPHAVTYVEDLDDLDLARWGPGFRYHSRFAPRGANANFVRVLGEGELGIRTWEFGVEGETLACGTGSAAAAVLAARRFDWPGEYLTGDRPILVHARGGDTLRIFLTADDDGEITDVCLETHVRYLYRGRATDELLGRALVETRESLCEQG